jgi:hypothetical protein
MAAGLRRRRRCYFHEGVDAEGRFAPGVYMMRSSWMMAGSEMRYEFDDARGRARGATVRMLGSFLGLCLQIDEPGVSPSNAPRHLAPHPKWITSERALVS